MSLGDGILNSKILDCLKILVVTRYRDWNEATGSVPEKLNFVSHELDNWFKEVCHKNRLTTYDLKRKLADLVELAPTDEVLGDIIDKRLQLKLEMDKEELYWEQRARANWLKNGDNNTSFSHRFASNKKKNNQIKALETEDGEMMDESKNMGKLANEYFLDLFHSNTHDLNTTDLEGIETFILSEINTDLLWSFTKEEVMNAVKSLSP
ncbi:uncharacterized protein LOC120152142 [Hibiscus syriacus]|uniref:uncharacterized protein LOC120152142 n=1 Tax=Hibiscus syriacus TaxID=106335 RepID=UPI0019215B8F|nr:uncharacterized protein LOC120152142 [Hibiscus syriacus]